MQLTEKMVSAITEIVETEATIGQVFQICDKHQLNTGEEAKVIIYYEDSKDQLDELLEEEKADKQQFDKESKRALAYDNLKPVLINKSNGFGI